MNHPIFVVALVLGTLGCLFVMLGMATPAWITFYNGNAGLFMICQGGTCVSYDLTGGGAAVKAFVTISFLCSLAGVVVAFVYFCRFLQKEQSNKNLCLALAILFIIAGSLGLLGAIIFAAKVNNTLGYSFGLTIVGSIFCAVTGALGFVQRSKST